MPFLFHYIVFDYIFHVSGAMCYFMIWVLFVLVTYICVYMYACVFIYVHRCMHICVYISKYEI